MGKEHPESLDRIKAVKVNQELIDTINSLASEIDDEKSGRGQWENRQKDWYRKRYGIRKRRTHPWPGYPNHILPLIDSDISQLKPSYVQAAFGVYPIVTFDPFGPEDIEPARKREALLDYRVKHKMDFFNPYTIGIDKMLQTGFIVFKILWKFTSRKYSVFLNLEDLPREIVDALYDVSTTDIMLKKIIQEEFDVDMEFEENDAELDRAVTEFREGKTKIELRFHEEECNQPELIPCDPVEDLVVPQDTTNINDARWIDYRFFKTVNDIMGAMNSGKYIKHPEEDIVAWAGKGPDERNMDRHFREGISIDELSDELIYLHEVCLWYDIDGDGILERCIATYPDSAPDKVLRMIELPYDHGMWPYVQVRRELVDPGFYSSRGIPALDDDFQTGISASFNNDLANQLIVNTPYVKYLKGTISNVRNRRFIPGEPIELKGNIDGYRVEQAVNASQGTFMVTQQQLKNWAQERVGNQSRSLTNTTNTPGQGQQGKKTAREVEEISFITSQAQSLDIMVFQNQMKWVYYQIDALYEQFGKEEESIMTGEEPVTISRREVQGRFNMSPTGKLENSNPIQRAQKAVFLYQAFRGDPDFKQQELKRFVVQDNYDHKTAKRLMFTPEERAQQQQIAQIVSQQQKQQATAEAAQVARVQNTVDLEKEAGMALIHGRRFAPDKGEKNGRNGKSGKNKSSKSSKSKK